MDRRQDWLVIHQNCLREVHEKTRECAEHKAAPLNIKIYCPTVGVSQTVYLRHQPAGRNKIRLVYRVVEVQGTTYMDEPLQGGPSKRVHRVDLSPSMNPVMEPVVTKSSLSLSPSMALAEPVEVGNADPENVVLEEVTLLMLKRQGMCMLESPGQLKKL